MLKHIAAFILVALINCSPVYTITDYLGHWKLNLDTEYNKNINNRISDGDIGTDSISSSIQKIICSIYPPIRQHTIENVYIISNRAPNIGFINYYGLAPVLVESEKMVRGFSNCLLFSFDYKNKKCKYLGEYYFCIILDFMYYQSKDWRIINRYKILCDNNLNPLFLKKIDDKTRTFSK